MKVMQSIVNSNEAPHAVVNVAEISTITIPLEVDWLLHSSFESTPNGFQSLKYVIPPTQVVLQKCNFTTVSKARAVSTSLEC
jgi:hypothetical protein